MSTDDPMKKAQELSRPQLPKRFYETVSVVSGEDGFSIHLDGRVLKTPGRRTLALPTQALARLIAGEWDAQGAHVDPSTMPVTRLANTAIDGVEDVRAEVARDIAAYALSDLVCYRAENPEGLVAAQRAAWDPLVAWFSDAYGMRLRLAVGIMPVEQNDVRADELAAELAELSALQLAALHTLTTLAGSAVIALAVVQGVVTHNDAWEAAHVDEDWQMRLWGEDAEAIARRALRRREFAAAAHALGALKTAS